MLAVGDWRHSRYSMCYVKAVKGTSPGAHPTSTSTRPRLPFEKMTSLLGGVVASVIDGEGSALSLHTVKFKVKALLEPCAEDVDELWLQGYSPEEIPNKMMGTSTRF